LIFLPQNRSQKEIILTKNLQPCYQKRIYKTYFDYFMKEFKIC